MCIDLHVKNSHLEELNLAANLLSNTFCESLAEYISYNTFISKLDISSNAIEESSAATLKGALMQNEKIVQLDVKKNLFTQETENEIAEMVTKNFLKSQGVPYKRIAESKCFTVINYFSFVLYSNPGNGYRGRGRKDK